MSNLIKFTSSMTNSKGEAKTVKPGPNGYYELILGALNIENSGGAVYDLKAGEELFKESSILMRRIKNGQLRSETGHPKKKPGMTSREFMSSIIRIDETNVCCHIKEVWLDYDHAKNANNLPDSAVVIKGLVKPSGPNGDSLKESLDNPDENVAFSIRSITSDRIENGVLIKYLKNIITWDYVNEPGIAAATKWKTLGVENIYEEVIDETALEEIVSHDACVGFEDSVEVANDILSKITPVDEDAGRVYTKW